MRLRHHVQRIAGQSGQKDERQKSPAAETILNVAAKNQEKVQIANEMHDSAVKEKRADQGKAAVSKCLCRNQTKLSDGASQLAKGAQTHDGNDRAQRPCSYWRPLQWICINFYGKAKDRRNYFPCLIGRNILRLCPFRDAPHFLNGDGFASRLRQR